MYIFVNNTHACAGRYNQEMSRQHNRSNWDLQMKMDLKTAAMKALPPDQLEYAMNVRKFL
jgi:hypothetical protein